MQKAFSLHNVSPSIFGLNAPKGMNVLGDYRKGVVRSLSPISLGLWFRKSEVERQRSPEHTTPALSQS